MFGQLGFRRGIFPVFAAALFTLSISCRGSDNLESGIAGVGGNFTLLDVEYGRLVEVRDINGKGFGRHVIDPTIPNDGSYELTTNVVTELAVIKILAAEGTMAFQSAYNGLTRTPTGNTKLGHPPVKGPNSPFGFGAIPNNAAVQLTFSLPVDFSTVNVNTVQFKVGTPPGIAYQGVYYSKESDPRVVIFKPTVSDFENVQLGLNVNGIGFPPAPNASANNLDLILPVRTELIIGQNVILKSQDGNRLFAGENPVMVTNPFKPTFATVGDIVRKFRTGGSFDPNGGFLPDNTRPSIIGSQNAIIEAVTPEAANQVRVQLNIPDNFCSQIRLRGGEVLLQGSNYGVISGVIQDTNPQIVLVDLGAGSTFSVGSSATLKITFDDLWHTTGSNSLSPCFATISPPPTFTQALPTDPVDVTVAADATFSVEFSEPILTSSVLPTRTFAITNRINPDLSGNYPGLPLRELHLVPSPLNPQAPRMKNFVVGSILRSSDRKRFTFTPVQHLNSDSLPVPNTPADCDLFDLRVPLGTNNGIPRDGIQDLAGNFLNLNVDFAIERIHVNMLGTPPANAPTQGISFRFKAASMDEDGDQNGSETNVTTGAGQGEFIFGRGGIQGRSPVVYRRLVDDSQTFVSHMLQTQVALQTPLAPLGARLMTMYRYHDVFGGQIPGNEGGATGPNVTDKNAWNVDVIGLSWAPFGGSLQPDTFGRLVINMGHSMYSAVLNIDNLLTTCPWAYTGFNDQSSSLAPINQPLNPFDNQVFELTSYTVSGGGVAGMGPPPAPPGISKYKKMYDSPYKILSSNLYTMGNHHFTPFEYIDDQGNHFGFQDRFVWRDTTDIETSGPNLGLPFLAGGSLVGSVPVPPPLPPGQGASYTCNSYSGPEGADSTEYVLNQLTQNLTFRYPSALRVAQSAPTRSLPSIALPLLVEYKNFNNQQTGVNASGSNGFHTSYMFGTNQWGGATVLPQQNILPATRCFSQGYYDPATATAHPVDPTNAQVPQGGFSPAGGTTTAGFDPVVYWAVIDMQNTVSIFHSRWLDTGIANGVGPTYGGVVTEPSALDLPQGTEVKVYFRGATGVSLGGTSIVNASSLDPYGNCHGVNPTLNAASIYSGCNPNSQPAGLTDWTENLSSLNGLQFIQIRVHLIGNSNPQVLSVPTITGLGISYQ